MGADPELFRAGPRNVPEGQNRCPGQALADQPWGEGEVIVLHEDDRIISIHLVAHGFRETQIHATVMLEVVASKPWARMRQVAQGPEALVGKAVVVSSLLVFGEPHPPDRVGLFPAGLVPGRERQ